MRRNPAVVIARGDLIYPRFIVEVPVNSFPNSTVKCLAWLPSQLALHLARVHGISAIMTRPVFHKGDQFAVRNYRIAGAKFIENVADCLHDFEISLLARTADVVTVPNLSAFQDGANGLAMILYVQPVAHVLSVAIYGERLATAGIQDNQRN